MSEPVKIPPRLLLMMRGAYLIGCVWVGFQIYSMLHSTWTSPDENLDGKLFFSGFLGGAAWFLIAAFIWGTKAERIDTDSQLDFLLGPRPSDRAALTAWRWGRLAIYGVIAAFVSWMALALSQIIRGILSALGG